MDRILSRLYPQGIPEPELEAECGSYLRKKSAYPARATVGGVWQREGCRTNVRPSFPPGASADPPVSRNAANCKGVRYAPHTAADRCGYQGCDCRSLSFSVRLERDSQFVVECSTRMEADRPISVTKRRAARSGWRSAANGSALFKLPASRRRRGGWSVRSRSEKGLRDSLR